MTYFFTSLTENYNVFISNTPNCTLYLERKYLLTGLKNNCNCTTTSLRYRAEGCKTNYLNELKGRKKYWIKVWCRNQEIQDI